MVVDLLPPGTGGGPSALAALRPAGCSVSSAQRAKEGSVADCLAIGERPSTPPEISKWRRSQTRPGERLQHPGLRDDACKLDPATTYGMRYVDSSDHVPDVWKQPGAAGGLDGLKQRMAERVYRSTRDEALGRSRNHGHTIRDAKFSYGVSSCTSEPAKGIIFPPAAAADETAEALYRKSHRSYAPGEQVRRGYSWPVEPETAVFGKPGSGARALNGSSANVVAALHAGGGGGGGDPPRVTTKKLHDFRQMQKVLGRVTNLGQDGPTRRALEPDHVFGKAAQRRAAGEWDVRACIEGEYSREQQQPDADLGRSVTPGFRNLTTEDRAFGVPAIRSDIAAPARRSVADTQNYGDGVPARYLVNPGQFSTLGVEDEEFFAPRHKAELRALFAAAGGEYPDDVFDALFAEAAGGADVAGIADLQSCATAYDLAVHKQREGAWRAERGL